MSFNNILNICHHQHPSHILLQKNVRSKSFHPGSGSHHSSIRYIAYQAKISNIWLTNCNKLSKKGNTLRHHLFFSIKMHYLWQNRLKGIDNMQVNAWTFFKENFYVIGHAFFTPLELNFLKEGKVKTEILKDRYVIENREDDQCTAFPSTINSQKISMHPDKLKLVLTCINSKHKTKC